MEGRLGLPPDVPYEFVEWPASSVSRKARLAPGSNGVRLKARLKAARGGRPALSFCGGGGVAVPSRKADSPESPQSEREETPKPKRNRRGRRVSLGRGTPVLDFAGNKRDAK